MLFNSVEYFVLLSATLAVYWLSPALWMRQAILLVASVVFYVSWSPPYLALLFGAIGLTYVAVSADSRTNRWSVPVAVVGLLLILVFVKYADFIRRALTDLGISGGDQFTPWAIILPLGISFYVFQLVAYAIDVRRGHYERERNPALLALFVMFFPHLIAGPICRPHQLLPQLKNMHRFNVDSFVQGLLMLACGLFLKVAIADNLSGFSDLVFAAPASRTSLECLSAAIVFGVVIFCDFWGYSTMAVGAAMMFGIVIPQNFNLPYAATSLQDFWRRWHITLSNWLRDYLYKPLGGSRHGELLTYRNLLIVMVLGGLWHGAAYTFIIWGALHGAWLAIERLLAGPAEALICRGGASLKMLARTAGWFITMLVVFVGWVFFRADSVDTAITLLQRAVRLHSLQLTPDLRQVLPWLFLFLILHVPIHRLLQSDVGYARLALSTPLRAAAAFWILLSASILGEGKVSEFIYFQF